MSDAPKKYVKINGIMKLNPEYKAWKGRQNQQAAGPAGAAAAKPGTTVLNSSQALPIVSTMEDYEKLNEDVGEIPLAEATNATIDMLQDDVVATDVGIASDKMIDELGEVLERYEIPIGLTNKLFMLSEYESLEFIMDDSGSMRLATDTTEPRTRKPYSRWQEAQMRLKEMIEIVAYVPFQQIGIEFLNRKDRISIKRDGKTPKELIAIAHGLIDNAFATPPAGSTPAFEKLQESLLRGQGTSIARYFFGDGVPNGGKRAVEQIIQILVTRSDPESNPVTFISCTNDDDAVEWMKDAEEIAPFCSESDDFMDEAREVQRDQGVGLPYSEGFHLICQLVAAMCPEDLDAMDESIPFTKFTLDNLLGIVHNEASYRHYFESFVRAQQSRRVEIDRRTGMPSKLDEIRKRVRWDYNSFLTTNGSRKQIPQVVDLQRQLADAGRNR
eukprot:CAMPEP_0197174230 /NCGR_PEP_ID=MMETSP1423-20130617/840_1 /TAXON_ID=476441 /ORGANISM="Pseudo-nitzschia heimii, Strain UNC1101" /LENGTH=441 /DNA_ID=CAMNT_0042623135 /DNA_START=101 /DNA_END=1426 /DNA_ORIENTATION=-